MNWERDWPLIAGGVGIVIAFVLASTSHSSRTVNLSNEGVSNPSADAAAVQIYQAQLGAQQADRQSMWQAFDALIGAESNYQQTQLSTNAAVSEAGIAARGQTSITGLDTAANETAAYYDYLTRQAQIDAAQQAQSHAGMFGFLSNIFGGITSLVPKFLPAAAATAATGGAAAPLMWT